jgi:hypothetical protein
LEIGANTAIFSAIEAVIEADERLEAEALTKYY